MYNGFEFDWKRVHCTHHLFPKKSVPSLLKSSIARGVRCTLQLLSAVRVAR
jgi:hypothetical protein